MRAIIGSLTGAALVGAVLVTGMPGAALAAAPGADPVPLPLPLESPSPSPSPTSTASPSPDPNVTPVPIPTVKPRPSGTAVPLPFPLDDDELDDEELDKATTGDVYTVTFAARWCPSYDDVRANRARNNIMESLQDLGPDTNYANGEPVAPGKEDAPPQSNCTPLEGWDFQLGTGIDGRTPGTNLSKVANPGPVMTTESAVPELDVRGNTTGRTIPGAVTRTLTKAEVDRAARKQLWVQGGTAGSPLGPDAGRYGFASLRCANDNLNGDNVEYVSFTTEQRHVFCYTYLVKPPPKAGVIIIKKAVPDLTAPDLSFSFGGNVSFNPGGAFSLKKGQQIEFVRGASADTGFLWRVTEDIPPDWSAVVRCDSSKGTSETQVSGRADVSIDLAAGDTVTCTFTNSPNPPKATLEIGKYAVGRDGTFGFTITTPSGVRETATATVPADDFRRIASFELDEPGTFTIVEDLPVVSGGTWSLTAVRCEKAVGTVVDDRTATIRVDSAVERGAGCLLVNTFEPTTASLVIRSTTVGGAGGASTYEVSPKTATTDPVPDVRTQQALNDAAGIQVTALPVRPVADSTAALDPGTYAIEAFGPITTEEGSWQLSSVACAGATVGPRAAGGALIQITLAPRAAATCDYTWTLERPSTLDVVKAEVLAGGQRDADVDITVLCTNGAEDRLQVTPAEPLPTSLAPALRFTEQTTCRVAERAAGGNPVSTAWQVTGPTGTRTGTGSFVDVVIAHTRYPGGGYTVTFTNTYKAGEPGPTPTPPPTQPPTGGGEEPLIPQVPVDPPTIPDDLDPGDVNVVLPGETETNAGRTLQASIRCTTLQRIAPASVPTGDLRACSVVRGPDGQVSVRINIRPVRVTLVLSAPATEEYSAYRSVRSWVIR